MFNHMIDFFPNYLMFFKWQSSINIFVQIWQYSSFKSRNFLAPFHIVGDFDDFHKFVIKFCLAKTTPKSKEFAAKCFSQNGKILAQKNHWVTHFDFLLLQKTCLMIYSYPSPKGCAKYQIYTLVTSSKHFWGY